MKLKNTIALSLCALMGAGSMSLTACKKEDASKTLYIELVDAGYGIEWVDPIIDMFEEKHPDITVKKTSVVKDSEAIMSKVLSGSTHLDLVFVETTYSEKLNRAVRAKDGTTYAVPFAEITDIYNAKVPGEEVLMKDKMIDEVYEIVAEKVGETEKNYSVPWMKSLCSLVVNEDVIPTGMEELPRTTSEFVEYCQIAQNRGVTSALIHSMTTGSYWDMVYDIWMHQYYGSEIMDRYFQGYDPDDPYNEDKRYSAEMFGSKGLLTAFEELQKILDPETGINDQDLQSLDFTSMQNKFLTKENKILFTPNGLWLEREMSANYYNVADEEKPNISFMKMPINSALGQKFGIDDEELSAIVKWIDEGKVESEKPTVTTTSSTYTLDDIFAHVEDARAMNTANYVFHSVIPAYSTKIALAKEFLQLMATDEVLAGMMEKSGSSAPFEYATDKLDALYEAGKLTGFTYSANKMIYEGKYMFGAADELFTRNSLWTIMMPTRASNAFAAKDEADRMSPQELLQENKDTVAGKWEEYLRVAGIQLD